MFDRTIKASFGGAEVQLYLLSLAIVEQYPDLELHFIVADYGQAETVTTPNGISLHRSIDFSKSILHNMLVFAKTFLACDHELVVQRAVSPFTPIICLLTRLLRGQFVYMVAHDAEVDGTHLFLRNPMIRWMFKWMLRNADRVVVQNEYQKERAMDLCRHQPLMLRNGYKLLEYHPNVGRSTILWIGRNDWQKQPDVMIKIMEELTHLEFVMICNPSMDVRSDDFVRIEKMASALPNCTFFDAVDYDEMLKMYSNARMIVNTSVSEGFPNTFIQAAMCAVPIVSLNANPDQILSRYEIGFCVDGDVEMMKERLKLLHQDNLLVERLGRNAYRYVTENHDITRQAVQLISDVLPELHNLIRRT